MISSTNNTKIKEYTKLHLKKYRDKTGLFIVEGFHLVEEARKANIIVEVFSTDQNQGEHVSLEVIKKLSATETPQPIVAICKKLKEKKLGNKTLVLNQIQDPGNVGTLIRTAAAFGWTDVVVQGVDIYSPKVIRSSQGAFFKINVVQAKDLSLISEHTKVGALLDKHARQYNELKKINKIALILGNEGNGINEDVIRTLDYKVYIPIKFESLNVAQAGAILLNEYK